MRRGLYNQNNLQLQQRRMQNKWFLSQQSKQKQNKMKIEIFPIMFRFPNHTLKLKAPDQLQSEREESLLTDDIT